MLLKYSPLVSKISLTKHTRASVKNTLFANEEIMIIKKEAEYKIGSMK